MKGKEMKRVRKQIPTMRSSSMVGECFRFEWLARFECLGGRVSVCCMYIMEGHFGLPLCTTTAASLVLVEIRKREPGMTFEVYLNYPTSHMVPPNPDLDAP